LGAIRDSFVLVPDVSALDPRVGHVAIATSTRPEQA
jgi:hypothetical protein